jgi:hypothetical protein
MTRSRRRRASSRTIDGLGDARADEAAAREGIERATTRVVNHRERARVGWGPTEARCLFVFSECREVQTWRSEKTRFRNDCSPLAR